MSLSNPNTNELSATDETGVQQFHMAQYKKVYFYCSIWGSIIVKEEREESVKDKFAAIHGICAQLPNLLH